MITKRSISKPNSIEEFGEIAISKKKRSFSFSCSRPLSSSQTTTRHTFPTRPEGNRPTPCGHRTAPQKTRGVAVREPKSIPIPLPDGTNPIQAIDLFHTSIPMRDRGTIPRARGSHRLPTRKPEILRRKEVIQPHLPVRLPCYDLVPITSLTLDGSPQKVGPPASGATHFHDLTGGVYKARERIHRGVADPRLLATPPSWSRVADSNPN